MEAQIINIGDEILLGDTINTNASWMSAELDRIGVHVRKVSVIGDLKSDILACISQAQSDSDLILITGGLGPTHDDITKHTLAEYFNDTLIENENVLQDVQALLDRFGKKMNALNRSQALIPSTCEVIRNKRGTAPGMLFRKGEKIIVSMPGVPHEMRSMMRNILLPHLNEKLKNGFRKHVYLKVFGIAEASLAESLEPVLKAMSPEVKVAFLPSPGHVKIRLSSSDPDEKKLDARMEEESKKVQDFLGIEIYGEEHDRLESVVGRLLLEKGLSLSTAESCTGGSLASKITSVPGSSAYFMGSVIAYANAIKSKELGISKNTLEQVGAVSREVVEQMARSIREKFNTDIGLSTSGIAGPDGGSPEKPVGTIWIAMAYKEEVTSVKLMLGFNRQTNIDLTSDHVLNLLRKELIKKT